jgi:hypothetical protein
MTDIPGHLKASSRVRDCLIRGGGTTGCQVVGDDGEPVTALAAEPQIGPTEYKLSLVRGGKSEGRLEQLTTQLLWRLQQSTSYDTPAVRHRKAAFFFSFDLGYVDTTDRDLQQNLLKL